MQLVVVLEKVARPRGTSPQIAPGAGRRFLLDLVRLCACRRLWTIAVLLGLFAAGHTQAGGSPETTLVVVNGDSMESRQIANHYLSMRDIPRTNLVWLDQIPESPSIDIDSFRERIWKPIKTYLQKHDLEDQIDLIVYSAGFPYAVDFSRDLEGKNIPNANRRLIGKVGSLTGLTYFARGLEIGGAGYLGRNLYFRRDLSPRPRPPRAINDEEEALFQRAREHMKRKRYEQAVVLLRRLTDAYPWGAQAWYSLAVSQAALERDDEALSSLEKAVNAGWPHSLSARSEQQFRRLGELPRFRELIKRMQNEHSIFQPAHGFRGHYVWNGGSDPRQGGAAGSGSRYFLSVMLGYTGLRGNSVQEVLGYLKRAAGSDGSQPDGTVYLLENSNIRAQTRERHFRATAKALATRGRRVEIIGRAEDQDGILPRHKGDVMGAVIGAAEFDWRRSQSRFLPGAIAEALTSYGGHFAHRKQTKLSEFLRHGAAGSSGAVAEPLSIPAKFPVSYMHVHYADGSSLAEAFYQSIDHPYQLLVVGDPLARPFARFTRVRLKAPSVDQPWQGMVLLRPNIEPPEGRDARRLELWVDGRFVDAIEPWDVFLWDTRTVDDGRHQLRILAVNGDRIETRSYVKLGIDVANAGRGVTADISKGRVAYEENIVLTGAAPKAAEVLVFHGNLQLAASPVDGGQWTVSLPARAVGPGPVELFAVARFDSGPASRSVPLFVDIQPPNAAEAVGRSAPVP